MVLVKLKRRGLFVLVMFLVLIVQSCSFEYDRFVDEADSPQNAMTRSNGIEYDVVLQSREFEEYDSNYANLIGIVNEIISRMSKEEKMVLSKLGKLYLSDSKRYETLFEYEVANILGSDSIKTKEAFSSVLEAKKRLIENKKINEKIKGNENLISAELQINRNLNSLFMRNSAVMLKNRTENNLDKLRECKSMCKESYDNATDKIDAAYLCGTAINLALCLGSLGISAPGGVINQIGLTIILQIEREEALENYDLCIRGCELSWKK